MQADPARPLKIGFVEKFPSEVQIEQIHPGMSDRDYRQAAHAILEALEQEVGNQESCA